MAFSYAGGDGQRGNLTSDGSRSFDYDLENRLLSVSGSLSGTLSYDPLGRIRSYDAGGATTLFLYDGDRLVEEYSGAGVLLRRYAHGSGVDEPLVWYEGAGVSDPRWLIADRQGSILATTNASGAATTYGYDPYGVPREWAGSRFRYTGQIVLPELQLYHYKARAHDPALGRFLQTDPVGYVDDLNLYQYARNDPVNAIDPNGRDVVVLNKDIWLPTADHQGQAIGDDERGWEYRSLEGSRGLPWHGPAVYTTENFDTLTAVMEFASREGYDRAFVRDTTPDQDAAMLVMADAFEEQKQTYDVTNCNCGDFVSITVSVVDPTFPMTTNPADTIEHMEGKGSGWSDVQIPRRRAPDEVRRRTPY